MHHKSGNRKNLSSTTGITPLCRSCHRKLHDGNGEFIVSTAARIIEDPKTAQSEALAKDNKNSDLMHVEFILCHADRNDNGDRFIAEDLEESHKTAINKPINWEHKDKNIGVIYESNYIKVDDMAEEAKAYYDKIDPLEKDFVVCKAAIWEYKHPTEARIMRDRASEDGLRFSMENRFGKAKCSECEEVFENSFEYCDHLLERRNLGTDRIFVDSNFVGSAVTNSPADKGAGALALANKGNKIIFADLLIAKAMKGLEKEIISYIMKGEDMKVREIEVPSLFSVEIDDLDNSAFADNTNRAFPINDLHNIEASADLALNNHLEFYSPQEKLFVIERIAQAAKEYDLDINSLIIEGGTQVDIDKNAPEFKDAVAQAVNERLKEIESGDALRESQAQVEKAEKTIEGLTTKAKELEQAKADSLTAFDEYKTKIEQEKISEARMNSMREKGFVNDDNAEAMQSQVEKLDDDAFAIFMKTLEDVSEAAKKNFFEKKKEEEEEEEDKDKKKKKEAKATEDPVKESEAAIASKTGDDSKSTSVIDECLQDCLGLE